MTERRLDAIGVAGFENRTGASMPWEYISYVTSGLTLVAFITATFAFIHRQQILREIGLIETAPDSDRAQLVRIALEFFEVDTRNLTKKQQFEIAMKQIGARAQRFRLIALSVVFLASILAVLSAYAISQARTTDGPKTVEYFKDLVSGDPTRATTSDSTGSAVQIFEHGWMLAYFNEHALYVINRNAPNEWRRATSGYVKGADEECDDREGKRLIRLGFCWYHKQLGAEADALLGKPLSLEVRAYVQVQEYGSDRLFYGLPGAKAPGEDSEFQELLAVYLVDFRNKDRGNARLKVLNDGLVQEPYCSVNWYPASKDRALPEKLRQLVAAGKCPSRIGGADDFTRSAPSIRIQ
jgi:hypothetical protein